MQHSSVYLINENFIAVYPSLAKEIGLNEAIILQQIHYWIRDSKKIVDGQRWTYNSIRAWQKQLPFFSQSTIKRIFKKLEEEGLIVSGSFNKAPFDKTKWYTIDYSKLNSRLGQNEPMGSVSLNQPIPNSSSNSSSNSSKRYSAADAAPSIPFKEIIGYLNEKAGRNYKPSTPATKKFIKARWNEGFRLNDFKKVIDVKTDEWKGTDFDYCLRPQTLFGTKFEAYSNQKPKNQPTYYGGGQVADNLPW